MRFIKTTVAFIIFNLIISLFTLPLLLSYGPYKPLRDLALQTLVETRRGPRIMALFMSADEINKLKKGANTDDNGTSGSLKIDPNKRNSNIEVKKVETSRYTYYVMLIHDPTRVKVAVSKNINESGERTSDMAKDAGAVAAINGGGFYDQSWQGNGGTPIGTTISNGKVISTGDGSDYVVGLNDQGVLMIGKYNFEQVKRLNIKNAVTFPGPVLIRKGQPLNIGTGGMNPRTAIGQVNDGTGTIIFLVVDGRSIKSQGATYKDLQDIMMQYHAYNAFNLDGGSSTSMFYEDDLINNPANSMGERYVPTAFVVMP